VTQIERLAELVNADPKLVHRGRYIVDTRFLLEVGADRWVIRIRDGRIADMTKNPATMMSWSFAFRASAEAWARFWEPVPAPGYNDLTSLTRSKALTIEGDLYPYMINMFYFKGMMAKLRRQA
jgi:hypothetical protein